MKNETHKNHTVTFTKESSPPVFTAGAVFAGVVTVFAHINGKKVATGRTKAQAFAAAKFVIAGGTNVFVDKPNKF